jgi:hypothetical protein
MSKEKDEHSGEEKDTYKVPQKVGIKQIVSMDKEDKSLENYKKQLLGQAATEVYARKFLSFLFRISPGCFPLVVGLGPFSRRNIQKPIYYSP